MYKNGQRVVLIDSYEDGKVVGKHKGSVVGTATEITDAGNIKPLVLVKLDEGFYNPTKTIFTSLVVVHSSNIQEE